MSNSPLLYADLDYLKWQEYVGKREIITWSAARFPSQYASVEIQTVGQDFWGEANPETYKAMSVGDVELNYIRKVFRELDKLLAPSFVETSPQDADITLMSLFPDQPDDNGGWFLESSPYPSDTQRGAKLGVATWNDTTGPEFMDEWEMNVIIHEIGHALHLTHPGDPDGQQEGVTPNPNFDVDDTVMSYRESPEHGWAWPIFFRDLDIHALQDIWGAEANPQPPEWPATEKFPNIITQLPYSPPKVENKVEMIDNTQIKEDIELITSAEEVIAATEEAGVVDDVAISLKDRKIEKGYFKLAKKISYKWAAKRAAKHIGRDAVMDIFVDTDALVPGTKKFRKQGKSVPLENHETDFIFRTLDTIDQSCGLSFNLVDNPLEADVVLSPKKMKKWEYYQDWPKKQDTWYLGWLNNGDGILDIQEKNLFTQVLMTAIGFTDLGEKSKYTTFDSVMSWNDEAYFGFTKADKIALESLWGSAS